ncbi:MAG TPA: tetratricopeptide repeat protein [Kiritimatiellia bacterium]|nr:tetratricopeptide repeat protein [Kiritimatiellia bacterium]HNS80311.1 tetratricopeptide repeat protein [Kiritimatiellia bacterium]HPA77223.1 tetratricopeptide repeat protein [Kiritimatiellia bacterium]HQQ04563.1 tetratricopeptide repeat protein [Kiritimatiellia bacterium]
MRTAILLSAFCMLAASVCAQADRDRQFADGLFARGYHEMAAQEYQELLAQDAARGDADVILYRLAECLRKSGNLTGAAETCGKLAAEHPRSSYAARARLRRAEILVEQGGSDEALVLLNALIDSSPEAEISAGALYHQGMILKETGQDAKAEQAFSRIVAQHRKSPYASYAALELAGIRRADKPSAAEELYKQVAAENSSPRLAAEAVFQQGVMAFDRKKYRESAAAFNRLLKDWPDDLRAAETPLRAAWALFYAEDYSGCSALAGRHGEESSDAWLYLKAACARKLGREDEAERLYEILIASHPGSPWHAAAVYEQARIAVGRKKYKQAADMLKPVMEDSSVGEAAHLLMIEALLSDGDADQALKTCRAFAERFPASRELPAVLLRQAEILIQSEIFPEASEVLTRIVQNYPKSDAACAAQYNLAFCAEKENRWEDALAGWRAARERCGDSALVEQASYREALVAMQLGRASAASAFEKFIRDYPKSENVHEAAWRLGLLLTRAGKTEEAEKVYRTSLSRNPPEEWRDRLRIPLAALLQQRGQEDEPVALLQPLPAKAAMDDMPPALMHWLAGRLLAKNAFAEAETIALALAKRKDAAGWTQDGWHLAGRAAVALKKTARAREAFKTAAEMTGGDTRTSADAALQWGLLAIEDSATDEAFGAFTLAAERSPGDDLLEIRARSYYGLGRVAEVKDDCDAASRYYLSVGLLFDEPSLVPECLWRAAECLGKLQRNDEKNLTLKELRERYPDSEWAKKELP